MGLQRESDADVFFCYVSFCLSSIDRDVERHVALIFTHVYIYYQMFVVAAENKT